MLRSCFFLEGQCIRPVHRLAHRASVLASAPVYCRARVADIRAPGLLIITFGSEGHICVECEGPDSQNSAKAKKCSILHFFILPPFLNLTYKTKHKTYNQTPYHKSHKPTFNFINHTSPILYLSFKTFQHFQYNLFLL